MSHFVQLNIVGKYTNITRSKTIPDRKFNREGHTYIIIIIEYLILDFDKWPTKVVINYKIRKVGLR